MVVAPPSYTQPESPPVTLTVSIHLMTRGCCEDNKHRRIGTHDLLLVFSSGQPYFPPPIIGYLAGDQTWQAGAGFILGDVGLTLLALIAVALSGGPDKVVRDFSPATQKLFWVVLFTQVTHKTENTALLPV